MKSKPFFLCLVLLFSLSLFPKEAFADIFDELAGKGENIGSGLKSVGYIIAGFGLIAFSVAAIFNKINWKTLAYIMVSTAILSAIPLVIGTMKGEDSSWIGDVPPQGGSGNAEGDYGGIENNPVSH